MFETVIYDILSSITFHQSLLEPICGIYLSDCTDHYVNDKIVNGVILKHRQLIAASFNQQFCYEPSRSFVRVYKSMRSCDAVQQGGCFATDWRMIAVVRSPKCPEQRINITHSICTTTILKCYGMAFERVGQ